MSAGGEWLAATSGAMRVRGRGVGGWRRAAQIFLIKWTGQPRTAKPGSLIDLDP